MGMGTGSCCPHKAVLSAKCTEMVPQPGWQGHIHIPCPEPGPPKTSQERAVREM